MRDRLRLEDRFRFLHALCEAQVPSLDDKLSVLGEQVANWRNESAAIDDAMPAIVQQLAVRHASELAGPDWESSYTLERLAQLSGREGAGLIPSIIAALHERAIDVSGATWQKFACKIAPAASSPSIRSALERFVSLSASNLPDDLGDGPWQAALDPFGDNTEVAAGLLWCRLGSPDARARGGR